MTLLKIVLLTNWWVSAVFQDFSLQVHLSACLSVSCFIVVLLSMPDFQLYPDSPNDNAAGKREVVDGRGMNKRSPKHHSSLPPLSPPPLSADLDSPEEIKPVCNPALPLHVCVYNLTTLLLYALSQLCLWSMSLSIKSDVGRWGRNGMHSLSLADSFSERQSHSSSFSALH